MRDQGKKLQGALSGESVTTQSGGVAVTLDGNMQMTGIAIDDELLNPARKEKLQNSIKDAYGDALKKIQRIMANKMQAMGGFPGLK